MSSVGFVYDETNSESVCIQIDFISKEWTLGQVKRNLYMMNTIHYEDFKRLSTDERFEGKDHASTSNQSLDKISKYDTHTHLNRCFNQEVTIFGIIIIASKCEFDK